MQIFLLLLVGILNFGYSHAEIEAKNATRKSSVVVSPQLKLPERNQSFNFIGRDPKKLAIERFKLLVSEFLTDAQISKSIDVAAVGMHNGKSLDDIIEDLIKRLRRTMSTSQISTITKAQKGLIHDLDEKTVKTMRSRIRRMIIYSFDPAAEQIHQHATRPSMAFALIAETLNPRFINSVKSLVRDILSNPEYDALKKHVHPQIVKL